MTYKIKMRRISICQILIVLTMIPTAYYWLPWLGCESLGNLSKYDVELSSVPEGAKCFYVNHGSVGYLNSLPISEDPLPYVGLTLIILLLVCSLGGLSFLANRIKKTVGDPRIGKRV